MRTAPPALMVYAKMSIEMTWILGFLKKSTPHLPILPHRSHAPPQFSEGCSGVGVLAIKPPVALSRSRGPWGCCPRRGRSAPGGHTCGTGSMLRAPTTFGSARSAGTVLCAPSCQARPCIISSPEHRAAPAHLQVRGVKQQKTRGPAGGGQQTRGPPERGLPRPLVKYGCEEQRGGVCFSRSTWKPALFSVRAG